jgi:PleD family two-component response regulator
MRTRKLQGKRPKSAFLAHKPHSTFRYGLCPLADSSFRKRSTLTPKPKPMTENKHGKILIVDDNEDLLKAAKMHLKRHFAQVDVEKNPEAIPSLNE